MKNLQKIAIAGFASLLVVSLAGCNQNEPGTSTTNSPTETASLTNVELPSQFYEFTTTNEVTINDEVIKVNEAEKTLVLDNVAQADEYVLKFSPDEKWVQLKGNEEVIANGQLVEQMETTPAFNDAATASLKEYLADDNYYHVDLWYASPADPNAFKEKVEANEVTVDSVKLVNPSSETIEAMTAYVEYVPLTDGVQSHVKVAIAPEDNPTLQFTYSYTDQNTDRTMTNGDSPTNVILQSPEQVTGLVSPDAEPTFDWTMERVAAS
jgi:hypothetical protein